MQMHLGHLLFLSEKIGRILMFIGRKISTKEFLELFHVNLRHGLDDVIQEIAVRVGLRQFLQRARITAREIRSKISPKSKGRICKSHKIALGVCKSSALVIALQHLRNL